MVLPFLGIYMTSKLGFSLKEAGFVLSFYGMGAVLGSLAGGWLTDKFGHFRIQAASLFLAVPVFISLPVFTSIRELSIGIFVLSFITDTFRPANSVSIMEYSRPENITRSFSLNRMALNLGFSMGPTLGGFFAAISYHLLFYGNATSSAIAGIVFFFYFHVRKKNKRLSRAQQGEGNSRSVKTATSPWRDRPFLTFTLLCSLFSLCFFQFFNTLPLYYKDVYQLKNQQIGLLLGFNGLVVFMLEMLLVSFTEKRWSSFQIIVFGTVLCGVAFLVLVWAKGLLLLYFSMLLLSVAEILILPFTSTVAIHRAGKGKQGAYMGLNSFSFSAAHILSPIIGTYIAATYSFDTLWISTAALCFITAVAFWLNKKGMNDRGKTFTH